MSNAATLKTVKASNGFLEILVRRFSHPWMPMALYLPIGALLVWFAQTSEPRSLVSTGLWVMGGVFLWSFVEYLLHRFVFHWTEVKEPWRNLASGLHMQHHRTADTADLILAPPLVSMFFGTFIFGVFAVLTWSLTRAALLETGLFIGYLAYEWVHFMSHRFKPKSAVGKYLKHYHLRHHFKDPHHSYGVTSPLWDYVFGSTYSNK